MSRAWPRWDDCSRGLGTLFPRTSPSMALGYAWPRESSPEASRAQGREADALEARCGLTRWWTPGDSSLPRVVLLRIQPPSPLLGLWTGSGS